MKKRYYFFLSTIIAVILGIVLLVFNFQNIVKVTQSEQLINQSSIETIKISKGNLNISVDPRIELLMSIQLNSNYSMVSTFESTYKQDMRSYFKNLKNHESIESFIGLQQLGFNFHIPPSTMMYVSNDFTINKDTTFNQEILDRSGGNNKLVTDFIMKCNNYAVQSDFKAFYNNHKELYKKLVTNVSNILDHDLSQDLTSYFGSNKKNYNLIISPMLHNGGFAHSVKNNLGQEELYGFMGPSKLENDDIIFSKDVISEIVWHEFSHSFVNPITKNNIDKVNNYSKLFIPINEVMTKQYYGNWETCVNEHIIRAITARLNLKYFGEKSAKDYLRESEEKGFIYINDLYNKLAEYETQRDKYKKFDDFYPELVKVFADIANKKN